MTEQPGELEHPKSKAARRSSGRLVLFCLAFAAIVTIVMRTTGLLNHHRPLPPAVTQQQYDAALKDFRGLFRKEPTHDDALMLIAETAIRREQWDKAVNCLQEIPSTHETYGLSARLQEGQVLLKLNRAIEAEESFREYLSAAETKKDSITNLTAARQWLAFLYSVELRFEERRKVLLELAESGTINIYEAKQLYFPTLLIWHSNLGSERLQQFLEHNPDDLRLRIAKARYLTYEGKPETALSQLTALAVEHPNDPDLLAAQLEALHELARDQELTRLLADAPARSDDEPWLLTQMRAEGALRAQEWTIAEACFKAVLKSDGANPAAHMGLARALSEQGKLEESRKVQERSLRLAKIRVSLSEVNRVSAGAALELADHADVLEMTDAAAAFRQMAKTMNDSMPQGSPQ
jgi:predicted Zn-dependent protease